MHKVADELNCSLTAYASSQEEAEKHKPSFVFHLIHFIFLSIFHSSSLSRLIGHACVKGGRVTLPKGR